MSFNLNTLTKPVTVSEQAWNTFVQEFNHATALANLGKLPTLLWGNPAISPDLISALQEVLACLHPTYYLDATCPDCGGRLVLKEESEHCLDCPYSSGDHDPDPALHKQYCDRPWEPCAHADPAQQSLAQFAIEVQHGGDPPELDDITE